MMGKKRIMIIDDDRDIQDVCRIILEKEGYEIISEYSASKGLEAIRRHRPDLIILDIMMEEADAGLKLAKHLDSEDSGLPILLLSSIVKAAEQVFDISEIPVKAIINKPISPDELVATVKKLI